MYFQTKIEELDTIEIVKSKFINWEFFKNKSFFVTGATGLIGSQVIKALLYANEKFNLNIKIIAMVRNKSKVNKIFQDTQSIEFIYQDVLEPLKYDNSIDFIIHTANNTSSKSFVETPVETINSIVLGTNNILTFAKNKNIKSLVYLSSMEVYGNIPLNRIEPLSERDYGYLDILQTRSSYQEGKKLAECLCFAYAEEYSIPIKIARLSQTIGAGVEYTDNRVFAQFARNIVEGNDILLKTKGETIRSYCYITDAISAIFCLLEKGGNGECYNIANPETTCSIFDMASNLCKKYPTSKLRVNTSENDSNYYLNTLKYQLDISKIKEKTNWEPKVSLDDAYSRLISSFNELKSKH